MDKLSANGGILAYDMDHAIHIETPIGHLTIVGDNTAITRVCWGTEHPGDVQGTSVLRAAATQLLEYFAGQRTAFDIPLRPIGGDFFQRVWAIMRRDVPYGTTISYSALATLAGNPRAARAVGMANHRNPIPIFIPCHRVLGKYGDLTGFRSGVAKKAWLLKLEQGTNP